MVIFSLYEFMFCITFLYYFYYSSVKLNLKDKKDKEDIYNLPEMPQRHGSQSERFLISYVN